MEYWSNGTLRKRLEYWSNGVMKHWSIGVLGKK
jgi:hypothetical protein